MNIITATVVMSTRTNVKMMKMVGGIFSKAGKGKTVGKRPIGTMSSLRIRSRALDIEASQCVPVLAPGWWRVVGTLFNLSLPRLFWQAPAVIRKAAKFW